MSNPPPVPSVPRIEVWVRRHPWLAGLLALVVLAGLGTGGTWLYGRVTAPPLSCGSGMAANAGSTECIGVDLDSGPIAPAEPAAMAALEADVRANNDAVSGDYVSIVLLQDMSPVEGVDTVGYPDLYPNVEGAITAAWRANHTAAVQGGLPKVKLLLANLGSQNAGWSVAADQIAANAKAHHITSVIGLGQSTGQTRLVTAKLADSAHLPVIGATVTGDTMNLDPGTKALITGFFRVSPTNSDSVAAATRFIRTIQPDPSRVAILQDNVVGDDYNETLGAAIDKDLPTAHRFPFTSPADLPSGIQRDQELVQQFSYLDQSVCSVSPTVVYFAARGKDLGAFVRTWTQGGTTCGNGHLTVVTGDDGADAIDDPAVESAVAGGHVRVLFTSLASTDEWGPCPASTSSTSGHDTEQANYDAFQAAFTGRPDVCTGQPVVAEGDAKPLDYPATDLRSGQAMITHDAAVVAITAARRADQGAGNAPDGGVVVRDPSSQIGFIEEMRCTNAVAGASGWIEFGADRAHYGNPIDKPVPIVQIGPKGATTTVSDVSAKSGRSSKDGSTAPC
jgi:hypothetical protein